MEIIVIKCQSCEGEIYVDENTEECFCNHCSAKVKVESVDACTRDTEHMKKGLSILDAFFVIIVLLILYLVFIR